MIAAALATVVTVGAVSVAGRRVPVTDDEAWFLHVVLRCRRGDVLYRDVFYGAGPLAVWLAQAAVRVSGPHLRVLRGLSVAYFAGLLLAGWSVLAAVGAPGWLVGACWVGAVAFAGPSWGGDNQYGQLAFLLVTVAAAAVAGWATGGSPWWLVPAGVAAGAALATKQSVGVAGVAALGSVVLVAGTMAGAGLFAAAVVVAAGGCLLPVVRQGTLGDLVTRTVANKGTYLATGGVSARAGLLAVLAPAPGDPGRFGRFASVVAATPFLSVAVLPVALVAAIAVVVTSPSTVGPARPAALLGAALAVVALAGMYPRADAPHLRGVFPTAVLAAGLCAHAVALTRPGWPAVSTLGPAVGAALAAWTAAGLVASLDTRRREPDPAPDHVDRDLPHLDGLPVLRRSPGISPADGRELREVTDGVVFLLRPDAPLWYLASGLTDPTPYDYPYASVFGPSGQAETIGAIERGEVRWVCTPGPMEGRLAPLELQRFVVERMTPTRATAAGLVYRLVGPDGDGSRPL